MSDRTLLALRMVCAVLIAVEAWAAVVGDRVVLNLSALLALAVLVVIRAIETTGDFGKDGE